MLAGFLFFFLLPSLEEMKHSSVQSGEQRFSLLSLFPPQLLYVTEGGREGGRSRASSHPAFEVWEVKITGTASRVSIAAFTSRARIKALAAEAPARLTAPLTFILATPSTSSAPLMPHSQPPFIFSSLFLSHEKEEEEKNNAANKCLKISGGVCSTLLTFLLRVRWGCWRQIMQKGRKSGKSNVSLKENINKLYKTE